ncbi:RNA 3'-terminal phosphate cyclase [Escherichia coli]|uniref:RNA 3'-terminal phosphate cyclase n=1 Tax=Escherichia coli TaxID=562 RepID=UPI000B22A381
MWFADGPSRVEVSGGTDNPSAPPADFICRVLEPLLAKMGIHQQTTARAAPFAVPAYNFRRYR